MHPGSRPNYLLLRFSLATDAQGTLCLHSDIRLLFHNKAEPDQLDLTEPPRVSPQLRTWTEMPENPKYSSSCPPSPSPST